MKKHIFLFLLSIPFITFAQKKKGYSRLHPNYGIHTYNDKNSVLYTGNIPHNYLQPKNTIGHYVGLEYQRVTRYGLVISANLQYGVRLYDFSIQQDVSHFDSTATIDLAGAVYKDHTKLTLSYWAYKLMVGYRKRINKNYAIVVSGGTEMKFFNRAEWHDYVIDIEYIRDNGITHIETPLAEIKKSFGKDVDFRNRHHSFTGEVNSFKLYIGIEKEINRSVIKNISIGIEGSRSWSLWLNDGVMRIWSYQSVEQLGNPDRVNFFDRNLSIGLRVAVGLWK